MGELPTWLSILLAGVSFGFGAGGAWVALGYRIKSLEAWKREHAESADKGFERIEKLERDLGKLDTIVTGPTGRNGHTRDLRLLRWHMHDALNWIAAAEGPTGVEFRRTQRPED